MKCLCFTCFTAIPSSVSAQNAACGTQTHNMPEKCLHIIIKKNLSHLFKAPTDGIRSRTLYKGHKSVPKKKKKKKKNKRKQKKKKKKKQERRGGGGGGVERRGEGFYCD